MPQSLFSSFQMFIFFNSLSPLKCRQCAQVYILDLYWTYQLSTGSWGGGQLHEGNWLTHYQKSSIDRNSLARSGTSWIIPPFTLRVVSGLVLRRCCAWSHNCCETEETSLSCPENILLLQSSITSSSYNISSFSFTINPEPWEEWFRYRNGFGCKLAHVELTTPISSYFVHTDQL